MPEEMALLVSNGAKDEGQSFSEFIRYSCLVRLGSIALRRDLDLEFIRGMRALDDRRRAARKMEARGK